MVVQSECDDGWANQNENDERVRSFSAVVRGGATIAQTAVTPFFE
jgi:hypothetical protein